MERLSLAIGQTVNITSDDSKQQQEKLNSAFEYVNAAKSLSVHW